MFVFSGQSRRIRWRRNHRICSGVNFTNFLRAAFSDESLSYLRLKFVFFWQKEIVEKAARKMLVKLTAGGRAEAHFVGCFWSVLASMRNPGYINFWTIKVPNKQCRAHFYSCGDDFWQPVLRAFPCITYNRIFSCYSNKTSLVPFYLNKK